MKVMLIQAEPPDYTADFNFPLGYASLDSVLTKHGHQVEILFTVAHSLSEKDIIQEIEKSKPQVIGIGGMWHFLKRTERLVKMIRKVRPEIKIVIGGWVATYLPELVLEKTGADFCIAGEGEVAFLKLINCLEERNDYSNIKGLIFKSDGKIVNNGLAELIPLEEIPMPNWEKFPMEYYLRTSEYYNSFTKRGDRVMSWAASRGCWGKCNFCTPGTRFRYKKIDFLMNELHEIVDRFHPTFIGWMDNLLMGSKNTCRKFCEALINEKFNFKYCMTGRVDIINRDLIHLLRESGCVSILYGLECANNEILRFMGKNTTVEQFIEAVRLTKQAGIGVNISAMFGQPGETLQDFANTLRIILMASDRKMPFSNNQGFGPLVTFPGAPIYKWAKENGYIKNDEDFYNQYFQKYDESYYPVYPDDVWINYTRYPQETVKQVLRFTNMMNEWNYHYNKALSLEDTMKAAIIVPLTLEENKYSEIRKFLRNRPTLKFIAKKIIGLLGIIRLKLKKIFNIEIESKKYQEKQKSSQEYKKEIEWFISRFIEGYFR